MRSSATIRAVCVITGNRSIEGRYSPLTVSLSLPPPRVQSVCSIKCPLPPPADHLRRLSRTPRPPASIRTHPTTTHTPRRRAHRAAQSRAQSRLARRARRAAQSRTQSRAEPRAKSRRAAPTAVPAPPRVALALEGVQPRPPLEASRPLRVAPRAEV